MQQKDFYKILGVDENASQEQIKSAYRQLAKKYHPDTHKNDKQAEERFKEISEAYAVLKDKEKRKKYDQLRKYGNHQQYNSQGFDFEDLSSMFGGRGRTKRSTGGFGGAFDFEDLFSQFFSGRNNATDIRQKGNDLRATVHIPFETAARGGKHTVSLNFKKACPQCGGNGGVMSRSTFCSSCGGTGTINESKKVSINIPPASDSGKQIRLRGLGEPGIGGGERGSLIVTIQVLPHPVFERKGLDLYTTVNINVVQAVLGSKINVRTFDGKEVQLVIPQGSQNGKLFKLKKLGLEAKGQKGDFYVRLHVQIPSKLSGSSRKILEDFAREAGLAY